jgi:hypothetical protein
LLHGGAGRLHGGRGRRAGRLKTPVLRINWAPYPFVPYA